MHYPRVEAFDLLTKATSGSVGNWVREFLKGDITRGNYGGMTNIIITI